MLNEICTFIFKLRSVKIDNIFLTVYQSLNANFKNTCRAGIKTYLRVFMM